MILIVGKVKFFITFAHFFGGLAQLARALDWQSKGQGFDSPILHHLLKSSSPYPYM